MTATAPITQDVTTLPRNLPEGGPVNIVGLTREELSAALIAAGTPERQAKMRTGQVWQWVYHWGVRDFAQMTNLAKDYRALLARNFVISLPEVVTRQISADGTRKYLIRIAGGHEVETVYIPEEGRGTLCVSSQVGCTLTCSFCHTGTQKLVRNLTAGEIVGQLMLARDDLGEWPERGAPKDETRLVSNLVLMGMGEPLYNFENVRDAMKVVMDGEGLSLSRRRITLSTSGVVPEIARTATEIGCQLAVSFHATTDEVRDILYRLAVDMEDTEQLLNAKSVWQHLSEADSNYRDVAQRLRKADQQLKSQNSAFSADQDQSAAVAGFRNSRFNSFPLGFFGSASTNTTRFGLLKCAMCALQCSMTCASVKSCPCLTMITAVTASTHFASGRPITATSLTWGRR